MTDGGDPLDGADVGETRTVTRSKTLHGVDFEPREFYGTDRQRDIRIDDISVVGDDQGEPRDVEITWEAELTKCLPPRWDHAREPRTEAEEKQARRRKWMRRGISAVAALLPLGLVTVVTFHLLNALSGDLLINGEPMGPVSFVDILPALILVFGIAALIIWGVRGGFPGRLTA